MEEVQDLQKKADRETIFLNVQAKLRLEVGAHSGAGQLALISALILLWATAAEHCDVLQRVHTRVLQTRLPLLLHWDFYQSLH